MDTNLLVESKIAEGEALVRHLVHNQFAVSVAFWVQRTEEGLWTLYLASSSVIAEKLNEAYKVVFAALAEIADCTLTPSEIKIIASTDPIARDAVALRDRNPIPIREPKREHRKRLGNLATEELFIYPRRLPLKVREEPNGPWQVLISELDDVWLTCDSEDDARMIAKARVLEEEALELRTSDEQLVSQLELASQLEKTADVMQRYRMGFGSRSLRHRAEELRRHHKTAS